MSKRGFSLLELVIVIGMLGFLAAVMVPAMSGVREAAASAKCKANLRQLAVLCQSYAMNEGFFPWGMVDPGQHDAKYWDDLSSKLIYPRENPKLHGVERWSEYASFCWDFRRLSGQAGWSSGEIMRGIEAESVFGCPKCSRAATDNWDGNHITGYNYNVCYLGYVENDASLRKYPTAWDRIVRPDLVVVFGDGGYAGGPNKFMRAPNQDKGYDKSPSSLRKAGTQAFRHGHGSSRHCNMAFVDGRVEEFRQPYKAGGKPGWVDEKTHTAFISSGNGIYGPRGFGMLDEDEPR